MKVDKIIALIKERVGSSSELPGWKSHKKMAVIPINSITEKAFIPPKDAKQASVSIILFEENNQLFFLLQKELIMLSIIKAKYLYLGELLIKMKLHKMLHLERQKKKLGLILQA